MFLNSLFDWNFPNWTVNQKWTIGILVLVVMGIGFLGCWIMRKSRKFEKISKAPRPKSFEEKKAIKKWDYISIRNKQIKVKWIGRFLFLLSIIFLSIIVGVVFSK